MAEPARAQRGTQGQQRPKTPMPLGMVLYIVGTVVVFGVVATITTGVQTRSLSYTDFKQMVRADKVAAVVISEHRIRGTLKEADQPFVTVRVDDPGLIAELEQRNVTLSGEIATNWWSSLVWLLPLVLVILFWSLTLTRAGPAQGAMAFGRSRAKIYAEADVKVTFADVAGIDEATDELREIVDFLQHPTKYTDLGGRIPKGVLLVGPPGTGKTLLARAVAGEAHVPFFSLAVLRERRAALDEVVRRLLDREVVEGEEVRNVLAKAPATGSQAA